MRVAHWLLAVVLTATVAATAAYAQQPPQPGPEHTMLKKLVGTWDTTMKMDGKESKGTATYKMDLGGLWLASAFEGSIEGQKFQGRGFDTYDATKKKYIGVWCDSMSTTPLVSEGTYDDAKKTLTMIGESPGMDGKLAKHKIVTVMPDENTINFAMFIADAKEPAFTIVYKRKR